MRPEEIIEQALIDVSSKGIKIICGGALFNWCGGSPSACDAFGAVLIVNGKAFPNFPKGWFSELCNLLGVDGYWFWRFNLGFSYRQILMLEVEDKKKDKKKKKIFYVPDEVSTVGYRMAKKWIGKTS